ncbi:MAG: histidine kinase [Bryobacteraceae bacterium]
MRVARVAVAMAMLILDGPPLSRTVAVAYLLFALAAFPFTRLQRPPLSRLALAVDLIAPFAGHWASGSAGDSLLLFWFFFLAASLVLFHNWWESLAAVVAWCAIAAWRLPEHLVLAVLLGALAVVSTALKHQFEERLHRLSRQSVMSRAEALAAKETERERIANDFHDGPLQSFMSLQMRLEVVRRILQKDHDGGMAELEQFREFWQSQVASLRAFVHTIRGRNEPPLADLGSSLALLAEAFEKESGIEVKYTPRADLHRLDPSSANEILQLIREGLHNIHKHAGATRVELDLADSNGAIEIRIEDNGAGFPFQGAYTLEELDAMGSGPASIRRRVHNLEGAMRLESTQGKGARLRVRIPLESNDG